MFVILLCALFFSSPLIFCAERTQEAKKKVFQLFEYHRHNIFMMRTFFVWKNLLVFMFFCLDSTQQQQWQKSGKSLLFSCTFHIYTISNIFTYNSTAQSEKSLEEYKFYVKLSISSFSFLENLPHNGVKNGYNFYV